MKADQRWRALRVLHEAHDAPVALLAEVSGLRAETIAARARRQGWQKRMGAPLEKLLKSLVERLVLDAHAIGEAGPDGYPKAQLDGIGSLLRTVEKLRELTAGDIAPEQASRERDDKIAAILSRIDDRIGVLARAYAEDIAKGENG